MSKAGEKRLALDEARDARERCIEEATGDVLVQWIVGARPASL